MKDAAPKFCDMGIDYTLPYILHDDICLSKGECLRYSRSTTGETRLYYNGTEILARLHIATAGRVHP